MHFVLASSSQYRQSILQKLHIPFDSLSPKIDESKIIGEKIEQQVARLAKQKAQAVAKSQTNQSYIIGSDQLACFNGQALGKPGNFNNAKQQLMMFSGQKVTFHTGLCVLRCSDKHTEQIVETFDVQFKVLTEKQITTYLIIEQPYDCAGSFKCEGLGVALFKSLDGRDPNTLIGLPLMALMDLFSNMSVDLFEYMR
jgi:MAF protein